MTTLIHISDIHFGALDSAAAAGMRDYVATLGGDLLVVSGDLTQRAKAWQFEQAVAYLKGLNLPVLAVPGNHDVPMHEFWERAMCPMRRYEKHVGEGVLRVWNDEQWLVVGMNSARAFVPSLRGFWKDGRLSERQLAELREETSKYPKHRVAVVVHHPLVGLAERGSDGVMLDATRTARAMVEARVEAVMSGHLHACYSATLEQHRLLCVQAGTTLSTRLRSDAAGRKRLNSLNRLVFSGRELAVEVHCFRDGVWALESTRRWLRGVSGWVEEG